MLWVFLFSRFTSCNLQTFHHQCSPQPPNSWLVTIERTWADQGGIKLRLQLPGQGDNPRLGSSSPCSAELCSVISSTLTLPRRLCMSSRLAVSVLSFKIPLLALNPPCVAAASLPRCFPECYAPPNLLDDPPRLFLPWASASFQNSRPLSPAS